MECLTTDPDSSAYRAAMHLYVDGVTKSNTFIRNSPGRAHSAAHNINHGPVESIFKLCNLVGSPISLDARVAGTLSRY